VRKTAYLLLVLVFFAAAVITVFVVLTVDDPAEVPSAKPNLGTVDEVSEFLSDVVGLDLCNFTLVDCTPIYAEDMLYDFRTNYTVVMTTFGGLIHVEHRSYYVQYDESRLNVTCTLYNGTLASLSLTSQDKPVFSERQETEIVEQAKAILERYPSYIKKVYDDDGSYVGSMLEILKSINEPENITLGEISLQFFINGDSAVVTWTYYSSGVTVGGKNLSLSYRNGTFTSFSDTWRLYNRMEISKISAREAYDIALEAAQKLDFTVNWGNGSVITYEVPDLSNLRYSIDLYFLKQRASWHVIFYFNERVSHAVGAEAIVRGDSGEVSSYHVKLER